MDWNDEKFIAFDFETTGKQREYALQPWRLPRGDMWPTSVTSAWQKTAEELRVSGEHSDQRAIYLYCLQMLRLAQKENLFLIGWNVIYDIQVMIGMGLWDDIIKCKFLDGMLLWRHFFIEPEYDMDRSKKKSYGLKKCVAEIYPDKAGYDAGIDFHDMSPPAVAARFKYNQLDSFFTLRLARHWFRKLKPKQRSTALIEAQCLPLVAHANYSGQLVDTLVARELEQYLTDVAAKKLKSLAKHGVTEKIIRSPTQLGKLIYDEWKLPVIKENTSKKTGKTSRSTDKEVLHELAFKDSRTKELRAYREALDTRGKFARNLLKAAAYNEDGYARPQAIVFGTYSGRFTYASTQGKNKDTYQIGYALHQMKRDKMFRKPITAPKGYTIVEFDAAGQEFRWMAIASMDKTMLRLCAPGEDAHSFMGARTNGKDYAEVVRAVKAKEEWASGPQGARQMGKLANLSLQYRTSAKKLRVVARVDYNIPMELPQAQLIHKTYREAYPGVPKYWERQIEDTKKSGYVETFAGRRVQVVGDWSGRDAWAMGSTAINYRIQGTGGDQKYLAIACMRPYLTKIGAYFAWDLHDGIYLYVPDAKVKEAVHYLHKLLNNLPYEKAWGFKPPIALPWDCKVGPSWGLLQEYKFEG